MRRKSNTPPWLWILPPIPEADALKTYSFMDVSNFQDTYDDICSYSYDPLAHRPKHNQNNQNNHTQYLKTPKKQEHTESHERSDPTFYQKMRTFADVDDPGKTQYGSHQMRPVYDYEIPFCRNLQ